MFLLFKFIWFCICKYLYKEFFSKTYCYCSVNFPFLQSQKTSSKVSSGSV